MVTVASLVGLIAALLLARHGAEPIATWLYPVAWWLIIVAIDGLVARRKGESLLSSGAREAAFVVAASVCFWLVFELCNVRVENWYYVHLPRFLPLRALGSAFSFATVLPAIFEVADLLEAYGLFAAEPAPAVVVPARVWRSLPAVGASMLVLCLLWPRFFYPLLWIAPLLLVEGLLHRAGAPSLLSDWESGQTRRLKILACSGIVCGLLWEALNAQSRAHWCYTVPGFGWPYYFRMPAAGLAGFVPFALCCYSFFLLSDHARGGRGWRLAEWPEDRDRRLAVPRSRVGAWAVGGGVAMALLAVLGYVGMEARTIVSVRPTIEDVPGHGPHLTVLRAFGLDDPFVLTREGFGYRGANLVLERGISLGPIDPIIQRSALLVATGMAPSQLALLEKAGVRTVEALGRSRAEPLQERLAAFVAGNPDGARAPSLGEVDNWIRDGRRFLEREAR